MCSSAPYGNRLPHQHICSHLPVPPPLLQHDAAVTGSKSLYSAATGAGALAPKGKAGAANTPNGAFPGQRSQGGSSTGSASSFSTAAAAAAAAAVSGAWEALQVQQLVGSITVQVGLGLGRGRALGVGPELRDLQQHAFQKGFSLIYINARGRSACTRRLPRRPVSGT